MTGIIKSYSYEKECGYINAEDGKEYFFDIYYLKNRDDKMRIKIGLHVIFTLNIISSQYSQINDLIIRNKIDKNKGTV